MRRTKRFAAMMLSAALILQTTPAYAFDAVKKEIGIRPFRCCRCV